MLTHTHSSRNIIKAMKALQWLCRRINLKLKERLYLSSDSLWNERSGNSIMISHLRVLICFYGTDKTFKASFDVFLLFFGDFCANIIQCCYLFTCVCCSVYWPGVPTVCICIHKCVLACAYVRMLTFICLSGFVIVKLSC